MSCERFESQLTAYLLGDLESAAAATVASHLETCNGCRALAQEIEPTLDLLRDALAATSLSSNRLSAASHEQILSTGVDEHATTRLRPVAWLTVPHPRLAMAAAVAIICGLIGVIVPRIPRTAPVPGKATPIPALTSPNTVESQTEALA
ncbi:MAG: zf-HC2 domain-containing protein, partial [Verrucomicrobia bacterium]|nr:zf-HC2 domain-containing protein [Verrucomicrobiota bacterium]